jgi:hypothetical protein
LGELGLFGLLDTGADETVLPAFLIERIGVDLDPGAEAQFRGVGGQTVTVTYGRVQIEVGRGHQSYQWSAMLAFLQGSNMAILGHAGFLQYFTATFNGHRRHVTLTANGTLSAE